MGSAAHVRKALAALERSGLLLKQDKELPNVVTLVTGERLAGSWWSHRRAQEIFATLEELADHRDVLIVKLIAGKDTLVHRGLWPALVAAGRAQAAGFPRDRGAGRSRAPSSAAQRLLARLAAAGELQSASAAGKSLARSLACASRQEHTASGRHETVLESWEHLARRLKVRREPAAAGRTALEAAAERLGAPRSALPWGSAS